MTSRERLDEILERLKAVQHEFEQEVDKALDEKRQQFSYQLHRGRVIFKQNVRRWHRQQRTGLWRYLYSAPLAFILSAPIIYGMLVPLVFLDLAVTLYQHVCFRIYGVPRVCRNEYLYIDRHYLPYLNLIEKINCIYCGYGNGLIEYSREVIGRTEQFWCPIKHARRTPDPHHRTAKFFDYGDADAWKNDLEKVRQDWDTETPG